MQRTSVLRTQWGVTFLRAGDSRALSVPAHVGKEHRGPVRFPAWTERPRVALGPREASEVGEPRLLTARGELLLLLFCC